MSTGIHRGRINELVAIVFDELEEGRVARHAVKFAQKLEFGPQCVLRLWHAARDNRAQHQRQKMSEIYSHFYIVFSNCKFKQVIQLAERKSQKY
jgi:hypothetical protein